ncbi:MAG: DUF1254 domain-containing protein [Corynebacterium sp.]|jgi:hypothetical protein|uniref:DUF1254 domain-containing protein n=1 Tax=Corynebacterium sp. TaxID=1720 RepID=UPI003F0BBF6D
MSHETTSQTHQTETAAHLTATATEAFRLGFNTYLWGYPLVLMHRTRNALIDPGRTRPGTVNTLRVVPRLLTDRDRDVVKPNNDTIYVTGWLELSDGPVSLSVPAVSRYYGLQLLDAYTDTWGYVGTRATGSEAGEYMIAGPDWSGDVPEGTTLLSSPTNTVWLLGRIVVQGPDDLDTARAIGESFRLTGPTVDVSGPSPAPSPHTVKDAGIEFFDELGAALEGNVLSADNEQLSRMAEAGIGTGKTPSREITDPAVRAALDASVAAAHSCIAASERGLSSGGGDWTYELNLGRYDGDHLLRSVVGLNALGALTAEEATYANAGCDVDGERFDGGNSYVLRFEADDLPPVDAFWSLAMYDEDDFLVSNSIDRFAIGDRTPGVEYGDDGSLEIVISHERPGSTSNWLPAPEGPFQLTLRLYIPKSTVLDGTYVVPSVRRL